MFDESWSGRVGMHFARRRGIEGGIRFRPGHHQQPNGDDGGDSGTHSSEETLRSGGHNRLRLSAARHYKGSPALEAFAVVEGKATGSQRGPVDGTGRAGED